MPSIDSTSKFMLTEDEFSSKESIVRLLIFLAISEGILSVVEMF